MCLGVCVRVSVLLQRRIEDRGWGWLVGWLFLAFLLSARLDLALEHEDGLDWATVVVDSTTTGSATSTVGEYCYAYWCSAYVHGNDIAALYTREINRKA